MVSLDLRVEVGATERGAVRPFEPACLHTTRLCGIKVGAPAWRPDLSVVFVSGYRGRRVELAGFARSRFGTTGARETSDSSVL